MPTKHIDTESWNTVETTTLKAIELSGKLVKETDVIRLLITKGAAAVTNDDLRDIYGFKPGYGVLTWDKEGTITDFGTMPPEDYATYLVAHAPLLTFVYGQTCTGKSSFKEALLKHLPKALAASVTVEDEDAGRISEQRKTELFQMYFKDGKNVLIVEHGHSSSDVITRLIGVMAKCEMNFLLAGSVGEGRKTALK
ncbi:hypothetical protein MWS60_004957 [Klebsiella pneumoniae]|nr:hypothetical protein [Klebsiella pneumoniae]ELB7273088.1 hypothetical protein [Klebsiella pneumoniae]